MKDIDKITGVNLEYVEDHSQVQDGAFNSPDEPGFTIRLICFALVVAFAPLLAAFDYSFAGFVLATPSFNNTFGALCGSGTGGFCRMTASQQSFLAIPSLFQALGSTLAGIAGSWLGRRTVLSLAAVFSIIGAIIMLVIDHGFLVFMVGKCVSGVGLGALVATGITYGVECIPPRKRPVLLSMYGIANGVGVFICACVCAGSSRLTPATNNWQWKTLVVIQIPAGVAFGLLVWCFPESPRWLLVQGQEAQARKAFSIYYHSDSPHSDRVSRLVLNVQDHLQEEKANQQSTSWIEMYKGTNLRRTVISGFILTSVALSGVQFVLTYGTVFLQDMGIENVFTTFIIVSACTVVGSLLSPLSLEYVGCRGSLLWSLAACGSCMLIFAAVSSGLGATSTIAKTVLVTFICLWSFCFAAGIGAASWLASSETHSIRLRTYGQASSSAVYQIWSFAATFWTPYMLRPEYGNMGTNVGYFYFGLNSAMFVITFLFVPETGMLSLEQVDDYFNSGKPAWKTSFRKNKLAAKNVARPD